MKFLKKIYNTIRQIDKINQLQQEIKELQNNSLCIRQDNKNLRQNLKYIMEASSKWEFLHKTTTSKEFPNTIRMVLNKALYQTPEQLQNFNNINRGCSFDPNSNPPIKFF